MLASHIWRFVRLVAVLTFLGGALGCGDENGEVQARRDGVAISELDDLEIAYFILSGDRTDRKLVAINGGPGFSHHAMHFWSALDTSGVEVVAYDQRGMGASATPESHRYYRAFHVADIDAVRKDLATDKVVLLGVSWGGYLAQAYAIRHPERVEALILVVSIPATSADLYRGYGARAARIAQLQAEGHIPTEGDLLGCYPFLAWPAYVYDVATPAPPAPPGADCDLAVVERTVDACLGTFDFTDELAQLRIPVLLVTAEADFFAGTIESHAAAFHPDYVETQIVPQAGHSLEVERPEETLAIVRGFLEDLDAP